MPARRPTIAFRRDFSESRYRPLTLPILKRRRSSIARRPALSAVFHALECPSAGAEISHCRGNETEAQSYLSHSLMCRPHTGRMRHDDKLQLAGPVCVIVAIMSAEIAARALASWPTSSWLWYLNLEVFRGFQYSLAGFSSQSWPGTFNLAIGIALPLGLLLGVGSIAKTKLLLAIASNLSLIYSLCLLYGSYVASTADSMATSRLSDVVGPSGLLASAILLISGFSSTISHRSYWRDISSQQDGRHGVVSPTSA